MREEDLAFDVYPRVVAAGRMGEVTIRPLYQPGGFPQGAAVTVTVYAMGGGDAAALQVSPQDGALKLGYDFGAEGEYRVVVTLAAEQRAQPPREVMFSIYALEADLLALRPFKGDLHIHSDRSDGREPPAYVAACCRRIGMDFMAITDHGLYAPSLEAIAAFKDAPVDLRIYPGEEVHPPGCYPHMVNFGGAQSVNAMFARAAFKRAVSKLQAEQCADLPEALRYHFAACAWSLRQIQKSGGLAIFCHPYWVTHQRYNCAEPLVDKMFAEQPFDAYEVIGGYFRYEAESNLLQVARYHEERAKGRHIPIVGVSDAHGCERGELFGWYYSIVLAGSTDLPDLIAAVKAERALAVEALPGETPRAHGPFRLARYAQFLLREVLPRHDALCVAEGEAMLAHLRGAPAALGTLAALRGQTAQLYQRLFAA